MIERSLQITYRKGKPFAAYLYLPRATGEGEKSIKTMASADGILIEKPLEEEESEPLRVA